MQELNYHFELATTDGDTTTGGERSRAQVGVVGSGDLEILYRPDDSGTARVRVRTSVDGFDTVWAWVLERFFAHHPLSGEFECNDFGATPGVVNLRLRQVGQASER